MIGFGQAFLLIMMFWIVGSFIAGIIWSIGVTNYKRSKPVVPSHHPTAMRYRSRCEKCGRRFSPEDTVESIASHIRLYHRRSPIGPEDRADWS